MEGVRWQQIQKDGHVNSRKVLVFDVVDSTNTTAMDLAEKGEVEGTTVVAKRQRKGRGRLGKFWFSPQDHGLYFSVILRPRVAVEDLSKITLVAGLAISNVLGDLTGLSAQIKWPNDVFVNGMKVAGILAESIFAVNKSPTVIIGVGVNVNTPAHLFQGELASRATSLSLTMGYSQDVGLVLTLLLDEIDRQVSLFEDGNFGEQLALWRRKDVTLGKWLTWLTENNQVIHGKSLGPNKEGQLIIQDASGEVHSVLSGDVSIQQAVKT